MIKVTKNISLIEIDKSYKFPSLYIHSQIVKMVVTTAVSSFHKGYLILDKPSIKTVNSYHKAIRSSFHLRYRFSFLFEGKDHRDGYYLVDKNYRDRMLDILSTEDDCDVLDDIFLYDGFNGDYYCRFENDLFGIPQRIIRRDGQEYFFVRNTPYGWYVPPMLWENVKVDNTTLKNYLIKNDLTFSEVLGEFRKKVKSSYRIKIKF